MDKYTLMSDNRIGMNGTPIKMEELVKILNKYEKGISELESDRDEMKKECNMYITAWQRELGSLYAKSHLIDALVITTRAMKNKLQAFEDVSKKDFR